MEVFVSVTVESRPPTKCMMEVFISVAVETRPPTKCMVEVFVSVTVETRPLTNQRCPDCIWPCHQSYEANQIRGGIYTPKVVNRGYTRKTCLRLDGDEVHLNVVLSTNLMLLPAVVTRVKSDLSRFAKSIQESDYENYPTRNLSDSYSALCTAAFYTPICRAQMPRVRVTCSFSEFGDCWVFLLMVSIKVGKIKQK